MGSEAIESVLNAPPQVIFLTVVGILYILKESVSWIQYLMDTFGLVREKDIKKKELLDSVSSITGSMDKLEKSMNERFDYLSDDIYKRMDKMQENIYNVQNASKEELSDKINLKFKTYFKQGYIPFDEYDDFVKLHDAYNGVGGNHSGDARFEKCIHILPIIDDSTEDMKLRFLEQHNSQLSSEDGELRK